MYPTIFPTLTAAPAVTGVFGSSPCRVYPFGEAPQTVALPYATHQLAAGSPENYLGDTADMDSFRLQFDVYAATATAARNGASVIRDALETIGYVVSLNFTGRHAETNHYRYSFDMEFMSAR